MDYKKTIRFWQHETFERVVKIGSGLFNRTPHGRMPFGRKLNH